MTNLRAGNIITGNSLYEYGITNSTAIMKVIRVHGDMIEVKILYHPDHYYTTYFDVVPRHFTRITRQKALQRMPKTYRLKFLLEDLNNPLPPRLL